MAKVKLTKTIKKYGNVEVIHGIDLDIKDGGNNVFFYQHIRNYNDILTVYEIFSEEHYNLKK